MKRILYAVTLLSMGSIMGCERIDNEITDIENRVDIIEDALIKSIDEQIEGINNSIGDLRSVDTELDGYIKNLEETTSDLQTRINTADGEIKRVEEELGEDIKEVSVAFDEFKGDVKQFIDDTNDQIGNLREEDKTLSGKIDALETYLITEISNTKTWAEETFATLEQYSEIQRVISRIKEDIENINTAIGELEKRLNEKIEKDIQDAIDALRTELSADYGAKIEDAVRDVTGAYTEAIATAKSDITTAYTKAIDDAINASESSMKSWVNETLADGYYDIAAIDAKLSVLEDALTKAYTDADAALAKQIEAQRAALNQAKEDLTAAYQEAIKEAIDTNNGVINKKIADAIKATMDKVDARLAVIDNVIAAIRKDIEKIKEDIADIQSSIADIETQIDGINSSIDTLENVDATLQQLIDALETEADNLQKQLEANADADAATKQALETEITNIKSLIAALQAKDAELAQQIEDLRSYVDGEIDANEDWANATFATLAQYAAMQQELADVKVLIEQYKSDITAAYTKAIENAIKSSESSMKSWVNETLADGYYDIAAIDAKLSVLEDALTKAYTDADAALAKQIEAQRAALNQAKEDLTAAYQEAIKEAIDTNNGVINSAIASAVATAQSALQTQIDDINSMIANIENRLSELETNFVNRIQSFIYIPEYSDGKATMNYTSKSATLDFIISPATVVPMVKSAFDVDNNVIKAFVRYTKTRAVGDAIQLKVESMAVGNDGLFTLTILENGLSEEFWKGSTEAIIYVHIADGNNDIISNPIPLIASGYVGDGE